MEYFGFTRRQAQKEEFMSTRAASASAGPAHPRKPRKPATITDQRFETRRAQRVVVCDDCGGVKRGNDAGSFWQWRNMLPTGERRVAWERGDFDARWYCIECYRRFWGLRNHEDVYHWLNWSSRARKKACFQWWRSNDGP